MKFNVACYENSVERILHSPSIPLSLSLSGLVKCFYARFSANFINVTFSIQYYNIFIMFISPLSLSLLSIPLFPIKAAT